MYKRCLLALALAVASSAAAAEVVDYAIDPDHTVVLASWSHFGYSHPSANFAGVHGSIRYDAQAPAQSSVEVTIPMAGLDTFVPKLDEHLKGEDFFDVAQFPEATFRSTSVRALADGRLEVDGDLTIRGTTRPVTLDVVLNKAAPHPMGDTPTIGFDATTTVKRSDFGVDKVAPMVSDEVSLRITTEARARK